MATAVEGTRSFQGVYNSVFNAVCQAAQVSGWTIRWADPSTGAISGSAGMSALSWGRTPTSAWSRPIQAASPSPSASS